MLKRHSIQVLGKPGQKERVKPIYFSLVDLGTDTIKTAVVEARNGHSKVLGHSLIPAKGKDIAGGRAQAAKLTAAVNESLKQAEDETEKITGHKIVPDHILYTLPERTLKGKRFTIKHKRSQPGRPITQAELDALWNQTLEIAKRRLPKLPGVASDWIPQTVTNAGLWLNNQFVNDPLGLHGEELTLSIYGVICQPAIVRALEQLSERLEVEIYNLVPASQAVAAIIPAKEALVFDVGAGGTNCYIINNDSLFGAAYNSFGGNFFSQSMSEAFKCDILSAEALKIAFSSHALSRDDAILAQKSLDRPLNRWAERTVETVTNLLSGPLPPNIYFTGGSAILPGLKNRLLQQIKQRELTFKRLPTLNNLGETALNGFSNEPIGFRGILFAPVLSLAKTI